MPAIRNKKLPPATIASDSWVREAHRLLWPDCRRERNKPYEVLNHPGGVHKADYDKAVVPEFFLEQSPNLMRPISRRLPPLSLKDLDCLRTLGKGTFGTVVLVRTKRKEHDLDQPGVLYAMKVVKRKMVRNILPHFSETQRERTKLVELPWNPFICGIVQTFSDSRCVYMMLELIPCGNFRSMIQNHAPMDAATAAFYYSNIACGLEFLGNHGIVHADLKPENILIGEDGYLCLTDFSSSAKITETGWGARGSTAYHAPECLQEVKFLGRHGAPIDWWASGCVLFEMLTRKLPFYSRSSIAALRKSMTSGYTWPPELKIGKKLQAFVKGLFEVAPERRLGNNIEHIYNHPWLENVNWEKIQQKQYIAPYAPTSTVSKQLWHRHPLPQQRKVPGMNIFQPSIHLAYDNRFPPKAIV